METLIEKLARIELELKELKTDNARLRATVADKIKPVIVKPAPAQKVAPQITEAEITDIIKKTINLTYVNNLYGK